MLSSLRNFFLSLFLSLIVFGISAYFLLDYVNGFISDFESTNLQPTRDENGSYITEMTEETQPVSEDVALDPNKPYKFTAVVVGMDGGNSQHDERDEADSIMLVDVNAKTQTLMISSISCDTKVVVKGYMLRLGMVISENDEATFFETLKSLTGILPDYYCIVDTKGLAETIDALGSVSFNIPMDMYYAPDIILPTDSAGQTQPTTPEIDLKMGSNKITGKKAVELFRYKGYSNGNTGRTSMQVAFIKELLKQKININTFLNAKTIYDKVKKNITTNFTDEDFNKYGEILFNAASFTIIDTPYPGSLALEYGTMFYNPNLTEALKQYRTYRKEIAGATY